MSGSLKLLLGLSAILGVIALWNSSLGSRYQLAADNHAVYRLDTKTGEIRAYRLGSEEEEEELNEIGRTPSTQVLAPWGLW